MARHGVSVQGSYVVHSAETVGNAFARQYYSILHHSPGLVHRFYQDMSKVGRAQGDFMDCTTTMNAINQKILSYGSLKADIKYVDAQDSYNCGIIVLVVGAMVNEDESRQNFTQTFFLAPQEKGYYVLNDIFRYVEDNDPDIYVEQIDGKTPATLSQEVPPMPDSQISELSNGDLCNSNGEVHNLNEEVDNTNEEVDNTNEEVHNPNEEVHNPDEEVRSPSEEVRHPNGQLAVEEVKEEDKVEEEEPVESVAKVIDEVPRESWVMVESSAKVDTPKKSYAFIVMKDAPATMSPPAHPVSKMQDRQVAVAPAAVSVAVPPSSNENFVDDSKNQVPEGKGHSIYCRNLPANVTFSRVQEVFQEFGPIQTNGIQIRHTVGFSYGFVEFKTAAAAQSAIEASPIHIDRHEVTVEVKRSMLGRGNSYGGNNRGRFPPGRAGSSFRSDGVRGRGGYGGGRGYGRGEGNKGDFGVRGGGRGFQNRDEGYQKSDQTGNGSMHMNRGGGPGHVSARTQGASAQA